MTGFSPKERVRAAVKRQPVDHIPTQINYTADTGKKLAAHFDVAEEDLPVVLGNHMMRVDIHHPPRFGADGAVKYDWWGVGFDAKEEGYFAAVNPLADHPNLDEYDWPDPDAPGLLADAQSLMETYGDSHFITPNFGFVLFERAWSLRGFEQFFLDMTVDPGYTHALLDRITEIQLKLIRRYLDLGVDGAYFGDDYGAQKNLLFSPGMWRRYIKPRLAKLFAPFRERELPVLMHSDGQIQKILPDLVEIGLTTLNPVQPEALDHTWLYEQFGGKLAFYGGISTQTVLPNGSPEAVIAAIRRCVDTLAPDKTGLVVAPSHRLMTDIPPENVEAMLETFRTL